MPPMRILCTRFLVSLLVLLVTAVAGGSKVWALQVGPSTAFATPPKLMISELQTGGITADGNEDGKLEFIELYNPGNSGIDITDWRLEYLSASHTGADAPTRLLSTFKGTVLSKSYMLVSYETYVASADVYFEANGTAGSGLLARGGGHIRVLDALGNIIDLAGWGTSIAIGDWGRAPEIPAGYSAQRILPDDALYTTGMVFNLPSAATTPQGGGLQTPDPLPDPICDGLLITELLPNPKGADAGHEFIELYNPSDVSVSMKGCLLRLDETGKQFALPDEQLPAKAHRAFIDTESEIALPNAAAQAVWLLSSSVEQEVSYPNGLAEDQSWSYIDGVWRETLLPTPGSANILQEPKLPLEDDPMAKDVMPATEVCPPGKERNPLTNRCRNSPVAVLANDICKTGYERNSETGRCRKKTNLTSVIPCKAGYERNPETGRCRSLLGASTAMKTCAEGHERNPETNRCRKAAGAGENLANVHDVRSASSGDNMRWWIAGVLVVGAFGYAVYEWRQDIWQIVGKLKHKMRGKPD